MEIDPNLIYLGLALAAAAGGGAGWVFKRGKQEGIEESCIQRIEGKVTSIEKKLDDEVKDTTESHRQIHVRIDKLGSKLDKQNDKLDAHAADLHEKINIVSKEVANIAGQFENHVEEKKD